MVWQLMFNDGEAANVLISKRDSETWRQGAPSDFGLTNLSQVWMPFNRSIGDGLPANYNSSQLFHLIDQSYDPSTGLITLTYVQVHQFLPPGRIGRMEFVYELKLDGGLRIYRESFKALGGPDGTLNFEDAEYSGFEKSNGIWFPTSIHQRVWMEAGKQLYMDNSLTISDLIVNGKLPPDTFVFTPPTGAIMTNFSTNVINSPPPFYENGPSVYEPYTVTTLAGSAKTSGSEDGVGSAAEFNDPVSVAVDNSDNIYVADLLNDTIRKITPDGMVTTFAGRARHKGSADGSGRVARFDWPGDVAVDGVGNVYVSDYKNDTIRTITPDGMVTTLAGQAGQEGSADGAGNTARFDRPCGLAVDSAGNVYVADYGNDTIRKISPDGMVTTLAGQAGQQGSTDGMGRAARFYHPTGVAVDGSGNVYVADDWNNLIRKITPAGVVTTFAGLANSRGSTDGKGNAARFDSPNSIAVDSAGNLYVTDQINNTIRKITPAEVVTTLAGLAGSSGSADGTGSAARFYSPCGMAIDGYGNLYVADAANNTIRKLTIQK
ncbi:MAG TPA: NHL repeat-containing protein [Phycisphaerae bacterium]|nr:NHL repeat-containing protein [Phycisphaerae bacterium]